MEHDQPQHQKLEGERAFQAAVDALLARPQHTLRIFDRQLGRDFNSTHRYELLRAFLLRSRANRLYVVLHDTSNLARDCPRLMNLVRQFSESVTIHETQPQAKAVHDPFAVADDRDFVHRFHYEHARALLALDDPQGTQGLLQRFEEIWEASIPAVSATTLGL